jgi:signal peptidase II
MRRVLYLVPAAAVAAADLISKAAVFSWLDGRGLEFGEKYWVFGRWFALTMVMNPGVTGGVGSALGPTLLSALTFLAVVGITLYILLPKSHDRWTLLALAFILGGAIGNLFDRLVFGEVRDFIDIWPRLPWPPWLFHWPTFNLADSAIVTGVIMLLFHSLFLSGKKKGAEAAAV